MIDKKLLEVLTTPPDAGLTIVTQGPEGPHIANTWNSYVQISDGKLLIPVGGMNETQSNIKKSNKVILSISNREVEGNMYKGTGFVVKGTAKFSEEGPDYDMVKSKYPWARACLAVTIESVEQVL